MILDLSLWHHHNKLGSFASTGLSGDGGAKRHRCSVFKSLEVCFAHVVALSLDHSL